jgi:hypothetical protein
MFLDSALVSISMQGENEIGDCGTAQLAAARAQEAQWL